MAKQFSFEITERIVVLGKNGTTTKELNKVSFAGGEPIFDLRAWYRNGDEVKPLKGLTLTMEEISALKAALNAREDIPCTGEKTKKIFGIFKAAGG